MPVSDRSVRAAKNNWPAVPLRIPTGLTRFNSVGPGKKTTATRTNTARPSRNPKERGCVRRGPAAAAPKPRRHPLESAASHAGNLLRLVLRAHRRAPGRILAAREDFPVVPAASSPARRIAVAAWLLVPEGRRRKLAGGKPASAGAAPGCRVKRDLPQRGIGEAFWAVRRRGQVGPTAMVRHPGPFLRCPAGARSHSSPLPGAASAADLPPANFLRRPSGTGTGRPRPDHGKAPAREWRSQVVRLRLPRAVFIALLWFSLRNALVAADVRRRIGRCAGPSASSRRRLPTTAASSAPGTQLAVVKFSPRSPKKILNLISCSFSADSAGPENPRDAAPRHPSRPRRAGPPAFAKCTPDSSSPPSSRRSAKCSPSCATRVARPSLVR